MNNKLREFIQSPLFDYFEEQKIKFPEQKFDLSYGLLNNITSIFLADVRFRCIIPKEKDERPQRNLILEVYSDAKSGTGKSTVAITVADHISKLNGVPFSVENNIHFDTVSLKNAIKTHNKKGTVHIIDETRKGEMYGSGSSAFLTKVNDIAQVCRARGLNFIRIFGGDFKYQSINPHYRLNVNKINFAYKENLSLLINDFDDYMGFIITRKPNNPELWKDYENKKMGFIEETLNEDSMERFKVYEEMAEKLFKNKEFSFCKSKKEAEFIFMKLFGAEYPINVKELVTSRALFLRRMNNSQE